MTPVSEEIIVAYNSQPDYRI